MFLIHFLTFEPWLTPWLAWLAWHATWLAYEGKTVDAVDIQILSHLWSENEVYMYLYTAVWSTRSLLSRSSVSRSSLSRSSFSRFSFFRSSFFSLPFLGLCFPDTPYLCTCSTYLYLPSNYSLLTRSFWVNGQPQNNSRNNCERARASPQTILGQRHFINMSCLPTLLTFSYC